jgi:hypothetical protein
MAAMSSAGAFPVGEEVACGWVQVYEAGVVHWPAGVGEERGVQGAGHAVGGEHVVPGVADPGGCVGDGIQDLLDAAGDAGGLGPPLPRRAGLGRTAQVKQVGAFGLVELKRVRDAVEDSVGCAGQVSSLHADVIVNADAREQGDLLASEPLHPAVAAVGGESGLRGRDALAPRDEELADLGSAVHDHHGMRTHGRQGGTGVTWARSQGTSRAMPGQWQAYRPPECPSRQAGQSALRGRS